jgi:iron(III) transport system substrate-binding protein
MRKFGRTALAFAVSGMALLFAVAATGAARAADKSVVIYSANESVLDELVFSAFTKETGIAVQPVSAGSGVVMKRISSEKERPQGDIVWGVSRSLLQSNAAYFAPYRSKNVDAIPAEYRDPNDLWIGNNLHLLVVLQNTKLVPDGQGPKSWDDLLDPKWKGKIAFTDPANSGSAYTNTTLLAQLWGNNDAAWEKVAKLYANMKVLNKSSLVFSGVGNGEYPLGVSLEYAGYVWASNGAPIKVIYPSDGTVVAMEGVAIIKGGPNPDSAKIFVDFINRKDTRELIFAKTFRRPARQDLDLTKLPGEMPALSMIKIASYDEAGWTEKRPATMAKIQEIVEKTR